MKLFWSPLIHCLKQKFKDEQLQTIIVPFIQLVALRELVFENSYRHKLRVMTRWRAQDLISGVSDPNVYPFLKELGIKLYINNDIHMKLYCFESGQAFQGSGNISNSGLGISKIGNVEVGSFVELTPYDYARIDKLFLDSIEVTDNIYRQALELIKNHPKPKLMPNVVFKVDKPKQSMLDQLPKYACPVALFDIYSNIDNIEFDNGVEVRVAESYGRYNRRVHVDSTPLDGLEDIIRYNVPKGLEQERYAEVLKNNFLAMPVIQNILKYIKENSPVGKGERTKYEGVQNGVLRQYLASLLGVSKIEVAPAVNNLERWLPFGKPEICVDVEVPGRYSKVFYWR